MKSKLFSIAVFYFVFVILIAHVFAPPEYAWTQNTISDLASQGHANKWIMQAGFVGFGVILTASAVYSWKRNPRLSFLFAVAIYGLCIAITGIFCAAPMDLTIAYSTRDADAHSLFATIAGISVTLGILWQSILAPNNRERGMRVLFLLLVIGFSALFGMAENGGVDIGKGIFQRLLYLSGLAWLVYEERFLTRKINFR
jgi:hypothetical membrane protein